MKENDPDELIDHVKAGTTCFAAHAKYQLPCLKESCRMWINQECHKNCTLLAIADHQGCSMTLQQIGNIHNLTRMRVCQIEKRAISKVKESLFTSED